MHEFGVAMVETARHSTSGSATTSGSGSPAHAASFSEPHEYRDAERTLAKLLDEMRRGRLPTSLLPLVNDFHMEVNADASRRCHVLELSHDVIEAVFDGLADPLEPLNLADIEVWRYRL